MNQLVLTVVLIFVVYFIGYAMGRKDMIEDIKEITDELKCNDDQSDSNG